MLEVIAVMRVRFFETDIFPGGALVVLQIKARVYA
jgi:hypothetical protein